MKPARQQRPNHHVHMLQERHGCYWVYFNILTRGGCILGYSQAIFIDPPALETGPLSWLSDSPGSNIVVVIMTSVYYTMMSLSLFFIDYLIRSAVDIAWLWHCHYTFKWPVRLTWRRGDETDFGSSGLRNKTPPGGRSVNNSPCGTWRG